MIKDASIEPRKPERKYELRSDTEIYRQDFLYELKMK
jgi:hypothetical protein